MTMTVDPRPGPPGGPAPLHTATDGRLPRLLRDLDPSGTAVPLDQHRLRYLDPAVAHDRRSALLDQVEASGLLGRGGARFALAAKLRTAAAAPGRPVVVVNGTEGEPASAKDRLLLRSQPHLVLDGALLAARAIGATEVHVCVDRAQPAVIDALARALAERQGREALPQVAVHGTPDHFVTGEERSLVQWINGHDAKPAALRVRPAVRGVGGRPTVMANVETLAHVAQIDRFGPAWFRAVGSADEPGTMLATVTRPDGSRRVVEAAVGTPLREVIGAGEGTLDGSGAVLVGGYFGAWITVEEARGLRLCTADLAAVGAAPGSGVLVPLPHGVCGWCETARLLAWYAGESAGQCGVCVNGLGSIAGLAADVAAGRASADAPAWLDRWASQVDGRGACHLPDGAARLVRSALRVHAAALRHHLDGGCPSGAAPFLHVPAKRGEPWR